MLPVAPRHDLRRVRACSASTAAPGGTRRSRPGARSRSPRARDARAPSASSRDPRPRGLPVPRSSSSTASSQRRSLRLALVRPARAGGGRRARRRSPPRARRRSGAGGPRFRARPPRRRRRPRRRLSRRQPRLAGGACRACPCSGRRRCGRGAPIHAGGRGRRHDPGRGREPPGRSRTRMRGGRRLRSGSSASGPSRRPHPRRRSRSERAGPTAAPRGHAGATSATRARVEELLPLVGAYLLLATLYAWQAWRRETPTIFSDELEPTQISPRDRRHRLAGAPRRPVRVLEPRAVADRAVLVAEPGRERLRGDQDRAGVRDGRRGLPRVPARAAGRDTGWAMLRRRRDDRRAGALLLADPRRGALGVSRGDARALADPCARSTDPRAGRSRSPSARASSPCSIRSQLAALLGALAFGLLVLGWRTDAMRRWRTSWTRWDWAGAVVLGIGALIALVAFLGHRSGEWETATTALEGPHGRVRELGGRRVRDRRRRAARDRAARGARRPPQPSASGPASAPSWSSRPARS